MARQGGPHRVEIVFTEKQDGQFPQSGQVQGFVKLAFGDGAVAEVAAGDAGAALQLVGERQADRHGQPAGDDGQAPIETARRIKEVHRTPATDRTAGGLAIQLGHQRSHRCPADQRMAMLPIGGDDRVLTRKRRDGPHGNRFLTDVQV